MEVILQVDNEGFAQDFPFLLSFYPIVLIFTQVFRFFGSFSIIVFFFVTVLLKYRLLAVGVFPIYFDLSETEIVVWVEWLTKKRGCA